MKRVLYITAIFIGFGLALMAAPQRGDYGASGIEYEEGGSAMPTASDYIQEGLIALWDGIENVDWGVHDDGAKSWVNLVNGDSFSIKANSFSPDSLVATVSTGYNSVPMYSVTDGDAYTFEVIGASLAKGTAVASLPYSGGPLFSFYANWSDTSSYARGCGSSISIANTGPIGMRKTCGLRVSGNDWTLYSTMFNVEQSGTWSKTSSKYGGTVYANVEVCCIRIYDRALSAEEIAHNYEIDRRRFNLPK